MNTQSWFMEVQQALMTLFLDTPVAVTGLKEEQRPLTC